MLRHRDGGLPGWVVRRCAAAEAAASGRWRTRRGDCGRVASGEWPGGPARPGSPPPLRGLYRRCGRWCWAIASLPGLLAGGEDGQEPARVVMLAGAAGFGLVMGGVLGAAQAVALRRTAVRPGSWVRLSV